MCGVEESFFFILDLNPPAALLAESPLPLRGIPPSGGTNLFRLPLRWLYRRPLTGARYHGLLLLGAGCAAATTSQPDGFGTVAGRGRSKKFSPPAGGCRAATGGHRKRAGGWVKIIPHVEQQSFCHNLRRAALRLQPPSGGGKPKQGAALLQ